MFSLVKKHFTTNENSSSHMNSSVQLLSAWMLIQSPCLGWTQSCSRGCSTAGCWTTFWLSRKQLQLDWIQDCILCSISAPCSALTTTLWRKASCGWLHCPWTMKQVVFLPCLAVEWGSRGSLHLCTPVHGSWSVRCHFILSWLRSLIGNQCINLADSRSDCCFCWTTHEVWLLVWKTEFHRCIRSNVFLISPVQCLRSDFCTCEQSSLASFQASPSPV